MRAPLKIVLAVVLATGPGSVVAQGDGTGFAYLLAPSTSFDQGLLGLLNPANAAFVRGPALRYYSQGREPAGEGLLVGAYPGLGFAYGRVPTRWGALSTKAVWIGQRRGAFAFGLGHRWQAGAPEEYARVWTAGCILRPNRRVSLGAAVALSSAGDWDARTAELGLRPLGTDRLTIAVGYSVLGGDNWREGRWSGALVARLLPGLYAAALVEDGGEFRAGVRAHLGSLGFSASGDVNGSGKDAYGVELARPLRNDLPSIWAERSEMLKIELRGRVDYLGYTLFDRGTVRFLRFLQDLRTAGRDPRIGAVALNLSGAHIPGELAWEIRRELQWLRTQGKRVVVWFDEANLLRYWFASVADLVVMDPQGTVGLPGFAMGRTYLKHALEKLGLGFQELRFFKYKSAAETLSRDHFSEADREQLDAYLEDLYATVRGEVCEGRGWSLSKFDSLVDQKVAVLAPEAVKLGVVDTLGRWRDLEDIVKKGLGRKFRAISLAKLRKRLDEERWGPATKVAVVYALGPCDMETGIRARYLERVFDALAKRKDVRAVVFRVDSPGGLIVPSDVVAQAIRRCREKKPVIVSQGYVAGSGGYWISAYGDSIFASPITITGSIGVIAGWLYDAGFGDKLGLTSDYVKRGEHADLMHGVVVPFVNFVVPHRPMTEQEVQMARDAILKMYGTFVRLVSSARGLPEDSVRVIAEGRIYSGLDGLQVGLVDRIGGLMDALEAAKRKAGIPPTAEVELLEYPKRKGLFRPLFGRADMKANRVSDRLSWYVEAFLRSPAQPLAIVPPALLPL